MTYSHFAKRHENTFKIYRCKKITWSFYWKGHILQQRLQSGGGEPLFVLTNNGCFLQIKGKKERDRIICEVKDRETEQNRAGKNLQAVLISIPVALRGTLSFITAYSPPETICMQIKLYIWFVLFVALPARFSMQSVSSAVHRCSLICNGCCRLSNPLWSVPLELFT